MTAPAECCPHAFEPEPASPAYACSGCGLRAHASHVRWYELGVEHGRRDAWSKPPTPRLPRRAIAVALALGATLVGAAPPDTLPEPPAHEALEALTHCLAAAGALEADLETTWGRTAGRDVAAHSRAPVRARLRDASVARSDLSYALADARPCAASRVPGCRERLEPVLAERRRATLDTTARLRAEIDNARHTTD